MKQLHRGPLTFGQLSVWRSIEHLEGDERNGANLVWSWELPPCTTGAVRHALTVLEERHESLRTGYVRSGPRGVEQVVWEAGEPVDVEVAELGPDPDRTVAEVTSGLRARPFELDRERPWRGAVLTDGGVPARFTLCINHMAADGAAIELLRAELADLLAGKPLEEAPPTCREVAAEQASDAWARRRADALSHWRRTLEGAPAPCTPPPGGAPSGSSALRSSPGLAAAERLAEEWRVSLHTVVLAAFCRAMAESRGEERILLALMAGNRYDARSRRLVSSVNQVVPLLVETVPGEDFVALAHRLHWDALRAYRNAVFDVDALEPVRRAYGYDAAGLGFRHFFNFLWGAGESVPGASGEQLARSASGWSVEPQTTQPRHSGFPLYFRVGRGDHLWCTLRESLDAPAGATAETATMTEDFLRTFHHLLATAAGS